RKYKFITKIFKFVAKFAIIGVAVFESITNLEVTMSNIINIGSVVFLVVQILFEIIISTIIKQIDYLRLAVQLDIEESGIFKSLLSFVMKEKKMEDKAIIAQGGSVYTPTEGKMINIIKEDAKEYEAKGKIRKEQIKNLFKQRK
ncbi:MAG: hypothetical protein IJ295_00875, partial [Clostridia bacterium]|nr:hypothetical protein [Clostridia bacterium]